MHSNKCPVAKIIEIFECQRPPAWKHTGRQQQRQTVEAFHYCTIVNLSRHKKPNDQDSSISRTTGNRRAYELSERQNARMPIDTKLATNAGPFPPSESNRSKHTFRVMANINRSKGLDAGRPTCVCRTGFGTFGYKVWVKFASTPVRASHLTPPPPPSPPASSFGSIQSPGSGGEVSLEALSKILFLPFSPPPPSPRRTTRSVYNYYIRKVSGMATENRHNALRWHLKPNTSY